MKLCLGILAYNEEERIEQTLAGLLKQDLWMQEGVEASVHVVVNGSRDRTAERARHFFEANAPGAAAVVHDLERAGKANAWNEFVHRLSPADAEMLILADADIRLPQADALRRMVETLRASETAVACVDAPRKDFSQVRMSWLERKISGSASDLAAKGPPKLCGQLYVARAEALRCIFLPEPLLVEDGLIKAMLVTRNFAEAELPERLVRAEGVYHLYEPEAGLRAFYRHEKRIFIGSLSNFMLFRRMREVAEQGRDAGDWLREQQEKDPEWFRRQLEQHFQRPSARGELWKLVSAPLASLKSLRGFAKVKALPVAFLRFLLTFWVGIGTARDLKKQRFVW